MSAPIYSTFALVAELFVSTAIYYSFYQGYKHNKFPEKIAAGAVLYEIIFNISYMVYRLPAHHSNASKTLRTVLGAFHGTLSLLMFISLIAYFVYAYTEYRKGINYFQKHRYLTFVFLTFWTLSILSGITFYFVEYYF